MAKKIVILPILTILVLINFIACDKKDDGDKGDKKGPYVEEKKKPEFICKNNKNSERHKNAPIVIMLSIDGFRADYLAKYDPTHLKEISKAGIYSPGLIPSYPTHTFPNHYTLVTGRVPGHHGIVSNKFYDKTRKETYALGTPSTLDGSWYEGEPIWNVAEKNGMIAHAYHWVGSEVSINGMTPTCTIAYDYNVKTSEKVDETLKWLSLSSDKRPHLINLYTSIVDSAGHAFGPDSKEVADAIKEVDEQVGRLWSFIKKSELPINLVIVSDHGMQAVDPEKVIYISNYLDDVNDLNGFNFSDRGAAVMLYSDDNEKIQKVYKQLKAKEDHFKVYLKGEAPAEYKINHPTRTGDIILIAEFPYFILDRSFSDQPPRLNAATHGWSYNSPQMHALFMAVGPNIAKQKVLPRFKNIDIYPFVMEILNINTEIPFDGDLKTLKPYLNK